MPELPEVETVVRGLAAVLPGRRVIGVRLGKTDFIADPPRILDELPGGTVRQVRRLGKFVLIELMPANGDGRTRTLLVHLGMTGQLTVREAAEPLAPHTHIICALDDGRELRYADPRRFGRVALALPDELEPLRFRLGADPLEISRAEFCRRVGQRRARIKALLLDQSVLRGVGNIYADESLWRARIHPARPAASLGHARLAKLHRLLRRVLLSAIRLGGSSISNYVGATGDRGRFQRRHRVYGRAGMPCRRCGASIRRTLVAGRSSYYCPRCQPPPRRVIQRCRRAS